MRRNKKERQTILQETIKNNPFITDEELAENFSVSVQTIRLDRIGTIDSGATGTNKECGGKKIR